jgi:DNA-binding NtrC family response regulator
MDSEQTNPCRGRRLLIVEDEGRLRDMLMRAATSMEFLPTMAASSESALALLQQHEFDIILTDLNLPGLHGIELCDRVRKSWPDTQIVILTGVGDLESARMAIRLDVVDFLTKPCSLGELETALNRALRRRMNHILPRHYADLDAETRQDVEHDVPRTLEDVEREHVLAALARHDGNRSATAEELGISVRTLYYRLKEYQHSGHHSGEDTAP